MKCKQCHRNPITRYVGLQLCNPCYYRLRSKLNQQSLDGLTCVQCHKRPARYKSTGVCHACHELNRLKRIGPETAKAKRDTWKARQPKEWHAHRAEVERERRAKQGDEYRAKERERHQRNRDQRLAGQRQYYARHSATLKKYQSDYRKSHPEWVNEVKRKRRNFNKGVPVTLTKQEWQDILLRFNHSCAYCGKHDVELVRDHAIPLSRGGGYTADNIVPACRSCNSRKHNKTADEFIACLKKGSHK